MNVRQLIKKITEYLSNKKGILLIYLFGSAVKNPKNAEDIDIAVLISEDALKKSDSLDQQIYLEIEIHNLLKRERLKGKVDIVVLNDTRPLLKHEVIKYGKLLYQKSEEVRCEFEVNSELKYYDFQPYRKLFWQALTKRIKENKFGEECEIALE